ncbi:MAG: N-acetyl-gamma-glutamyl-phosphate reductase [Gammaproteobacteria bacterium]
MKQVGLIGARGFVGGELIRALQGHPEFELAYASSRALAGQLLRRAVPGSSSSLQFERLTHEDIAERNADIVVLALPNGLASDYEAVLPESTVVIDLSADYRFDDSWYYGLPELTRDKAANQRRICNPGCYATAMQLALHPVRDLLDTPPSCFGVSGYSGAGTKKSRYNNPSTLDKNIIPYKTIDHIHEREVSRQLESPVHFTPHVASFFRGILMTVNIRFNSPLSLGDFQSRYAQAYASEAMIEMTEDVPMVNAAVGKSGATLGGFAVSDDGLRAVVHCTLDNLLKGAATQALQNMNLACGLNEFEGIRFG